MTTAPTDLVDEVLARVARLPEFGIKDLPAELGQLINRENLLDQAAFSIATIVALDRDTDAIIAQHAAEALENPADGQVDE